MIDSKGLPKVEVITEGMSTRWGIGTVVIPAPMEVDKIMKRVPEGKLITVNEIRNVLAKNHRATMGCPITTGIFAMIAAHAAREEMEKGKTRVTAYWRTLKSNGEINSKYPGGIKDQKTRLESGGEKAIRKGKKYVVKDYEKHLIQG